MHHPFYFEDVIGFDPTTSISTGSFTVTRNGKTIHVRSIQVGVIGKERKIWGLWNSSNEQGILFIEKWYGFAWRTYL